MFSDQPLHFSRHYAGLIGVLEDWIMSYDPRLLFQEISVCLHESPSKTLVEISQNLRVSSPWRNSVHSNDAADNGDSDNFVVVMVVESKNEVFSIPESLETIE